MGKKRVKDEPIFYDEVKKDTIVMLTETARRRLSEQAEQLGISRSELVERFARGLLEEQNSKKRKRSRQLPKTG